MHTGLHWFEFTDATQTDRWFGWRMQTVRIGLDCSNIFLDWSGLVTALLLIWFGLDLVRTLNYSQPYSHMCPIYPGLLLTHVSKLPGAAHKNPEKWTKKQGHTYHAPSKLYRLDKFCLFTRLCTWGYRALLIRLCSCRYVPFIVCQAT
jgi:hypothetical protein